MIEAKFYFDESLHGEVTLNFVVGGELLFQQKLSDLCTGFAIMDIITHAGKELDSEKADLIIKKVNEDTGYYLEGLLNRINSKKAKSYGNRLAN